MRLTKAQLQFIINSDVERMAQYLIEDDGVTIINALDMIYNSQIYQKLQDRKTGLYLYSPAYIYNYLKEEILSD
jgi:hypothetical protein